jgi:hypothetical protein
MKYKKYLLIKECVGTESYISERLEMDIRDVWEYEIILSENKQDHYYAKVISQSDDKDELIELMQEMEEADFYFGM